MSLSHLATTPSPRPAEADTAAEVALDVLQVVGFGIGGLLIGLAVSIILSVIAMALRRHDPIWRPFSKRLRLPQRLLSVTLGAGIGILFATQTSVAGYEVPWRPIFIQVFTIALIVVSGYVLSSLMFAIEDAVLLKFEDSEETGHARRVRTQMQMIRRIGIAIVWVSAIVGVLMTFPAFRGIGATFFASAGLASIVAGIAAQSTLGNIFAGVQIAFTDSIRVGDVVHVEGEMGAIEELTLTYVVVRIWDGRRLILPSNYFTTKAFQNWTRRDSQLLGTVVMEVDWFTPVPALRIELQRIVEASDIWDGRTASLQVIDAADGKITVRAVVSAANPGQLWDLRCLVREELVEWMQKKAAYSVPRIRMEPNTTSAPPLEDREEFIDDVEREWAQTRPAEEDEEEAPAPPATEDEDDDSVFGWVFGREDPAKRARREAERADRRASRKDPTILSGHERVLPLPSHEETRLFTPEELAALEAAHSASSPVHSASTPDDGAPSLDDGAASSRTQAATPGVGLARDTVEGEEREPERTSILPPARPVHPRGIGPHSAESRLYSGSPEADERGRQLEGPAPEDQAEREEIAKRRSTDPAAAADAAESLAPDEAEDTTERGD